MSADVRALSLWQPWASLCVPLAPGEKPVKTIETRGKPTKYRGRLLLHAAKTVVAGHFGEFSVLPAHLPEIAESHCLWAEPGWQPLLLGAIVGSVELVDVVPTGDPDDDPIRSGFAYVAANEELRGWTRDADDVVWVGSAQEPYGDFTPGRWAWLLEDAKRTDERCPACWGVGGGYEVEVSPGDIALHGGCPTCHGKGSCDPIPAKGRQGLWRPDSELVAL